MPRIVMMVAVLVGRDVGVTNAKANVEMVEWRRYEGPDQGKRRDERQHTVGHWHSCCRLDTRVVKLEALVRARNQPATIPGGGMTQMRLRRKLAAVVLGTLALLAVHTPAAAHETTHTGTVVALKTAKYAQPTGPAREVQELEVSVVDPKTKKASTRTFTITGRTKLLRDGKTITIGEAGVQKGEQVAVVVDHDKPGDDAIEVRLTTKK